MTPAAIIRQAAADGVALSLSSAGTIKVIGEPSAVDRWVMVIRTQKPGIVAALRKAEFDLDEASPPTRVAKLEQALRSNPGLHLALGTDVDADLDAVIVSLAIRDKGACELRIPKSKYDAFALLRLIQRHTRPETLQ